MNRQERLEQLASLVIDRGSITVEELVDELGVSSATVRRDLDAIAAQQLVVRTRGGAKSNTSSGELPIRYRQGVQSNEKQAIAHAAAQLIKPGQVVGFNGGTTTTLTAHEVALRVSAENTFADEHLTVVTNAVNIANDLAIRPHMRVVITGGIVRARSYELSGPLANLILPHLSIDTLFLGINALDVDSGIYADHEGEAFINAALAAAARRVVVVAQAAKIGATAFAKICPLSDIHTVITGSSVDPVAVEKLREHNVDVIIVQEH